MMVCDDAASGQDEVEKSDADDLSASLSGPTMWLGAQDGRYSTPVESIQ